MKWIVIAILSFVTMQRVAELLLARSNTQALLAAGAREYSPGHYPLIVGVHAAWLAVLFWGAPSRSIDWPLFALFVLLQLGRVWVIRTLGPRWTTRIIVLPGAPLVTHGPYRFVSHPNYLIVAGEIAVLPLVFDMWRVALVFTIANGIVLYFRIKAEERALAEAASLSP